MNLNDNFHVDAAQEVLHAAPTVTLQEQQAFEQLVNPRSKKELTEMRAKIKSIFPKEMNIIEEGFDGQAIDTLLCVGGNCVIRVEHTATDVKLILQQATPMIGNANIKIDTPPSD